MFVHSVHLYNFRNYGESSFAFEKRLIAITGRNGCGKTNLVDAIHYLCLTKSYFATTDFQNIRHQASGFALRATIEKELVHTIKCRVEKDKRKDFYLDDQRYERLSDHIGSFPVVFSAPTDATLIYGGSEERRRLLDIALSQTDPLYLQQLQEYNRLLLQRNALLKSFAESGSFNASLLETYDEKIIGPATYLYQHRKRAVMEIGAPLQQLCNLLSDEHESMTLHYASDLSETSQEALLAANIAKDRASGRTTAGIHRDDLLFSMDDNVIRRFASQGQQKSFLLALKLGIYEWLRQKTGIKPLLILDDVFDKLDAQRSRRLLHILFSDNYGQVFLTDTDHDLLRKMLTSRDDATLLHLENFPVTS
ncbi:MAG: DNA replication and repair protein RecF [Chitinophagales bacterium]|nr:MAG: DNA replication and repair protein RecF [Chitinophagales bacterium]